MNLVGEFNRAVFACSGGNPGNLALLRASDLLLVTEGQGLGWELDPNRARPHKTHANTALIRANAGPDRTGPAQQFHYRGVGEPATAGEPMTGFDLQIQQVFVQWRYVYEHERSVVVKIQPSIWVAHVLHEACAASCVASANRS